MTKGRLAILGAAVVVVAAPTPSWAIGLTETEHVSQGVQNGNGAFASVFRGALSDGSRTYFSTGESLAPSDLDSSTDVYMRQGGVTTHISQGAQNGNGAFTATFQAASADGSRAFFSTSESLSSTDTDSSTDIYRREGGVTTQISQGAQNGNGAFTSSLVGISADGAKVFFSTSEALEATDTDSAADVFMREGGTTTHISQGAQNGNGAFAAVLVALADDGGQAILISDEQLTADDTDDATDIYLRDGGQTIRLSTGTQDSNGSVDAFFAGVSADLGRVFFETAEQLEPTDTDSALDTYMREGNQTTHVTQGAQNGDGDFDAVSTGASLDGFRVFFETNEQLTSSDTDSHQDVYLFEAGQTTQLSVGTAGGNGAFNSSFAGASDDGSRVFFESEEALETGGSNGRLDVYMREGSQTKLISQGNVIGGSTDRFFAGASSDGSIVFFETQARLLSSDTDTSTDVYARAGGQTAHVSRGAQNGNGVFPAFLAGVSQDGAKAFFESSEQLTASDQDASQDIFAASIDAVPPETEITSGPSGPTNDRTPDFTFVSSEPGATFRCRIGTGNFQACNSGSFTGATVLSGTRTFEVKATDPFGNEDPTPASRTFVIDIRAPETVINSTFAHSGSDPPPPPPPFGQLATSDNTLEFGFEADEAGTTFECWIGYDAPSPCNSGTFTSQPLPDAVHTFFVRATDAAGNTDPSPATFSFRVDTVLPETVIDVGPNGPTNQSSPRFEASASEQVREYRCRFDNQPFQSCNRSAQPATPLADGRHTFEISAIDPAGNEDPTPALRSFKVDTKAPKTIRGKGPGPEFSGPRASFRFSSERGAKFICRLDKKRFRLCDSPASVAYLAPGRHRFRVWTIDSAGNFDLTAAIWKFRVTTAQPLDPSP